MTPDQFAADPYGGQPDPANNDPLPWRVRVDQYRGESPEISIWSAGEHEPCVAGDLTRANAAFIVRAVNAHDGLLAALTEGAQLNLPDLLEWVAARLVQQGDDPDVDFVLTLHDRAKLCRAAIARATS